MARLLFVTSRLPYPPREGHQLRSWHLLRAAAAGHQVDLLSLCRPDDPGVPPEPLRSCVDRLETVPVPALADPATVLRLAGASLRRDGAWLPARYVDADLRRRFRRLAAQADLVHLDILAVAALQDSLERACPVVLDEHNVEHELLLARAAIEPSAWRRRLLGWQAYRLRAFEADACRRASRVLACSAVDATRLQALAPQGAIEVIPNGVDLDALRPDGGASEQEGRLVFVGQMSWFPNRDGVQWFTAEVLPRIRARTAAHLEVVGQRAGLPDPPGDDPGWRYAGFVDDLRAEVLRAAVFVVPLRAGSGTRLKLLEAMALGKAIVSTRIGAEGIALEHGEHALLADGPEEFAAAVCRLLADAPLRRRLGAAARGLAERHYGWDAIGGRLREIYGELLAPRAARQR
jgi:glycosyltransferase involved in cell wall biosynthesis